MTDKETLIYIKKTYHSAILAATRVWGGRPEVIAGILMRETLGGLSPLLYPPGPAGTGDNGHGHGLMQIDDRSFPAFTDSDKWQDPAENIKFGAYVLNQKTTFFELKKDFIGRHKPERLGIAAYNGGETRVYNAVRYNEDPDSVTTGYNYSRKVLEYAEIYVSLEDVETSAPEPSLAVVPPPPPLIVETPPQLTPDFRTPLVPSYTPIPAPTPAISPTPTPTPTTFISAAQPETQTSKKKRRS